MSENRKLDGLVIVILLFMLYGFFSQYLFTSIFAGVVLAIIINRLWIPNVPPMLLYVFGFQFLQVFGAVLYADLIGESMDELFNSRGAETLVNVTFFQLALITFVISRSYEVKQPVSHDYLKQAVEQLDVKKIMIGYAVTTLIFPTIIILSYASPSLNQLVQSFTVIKKVFLLMLIFVLFLKKTEYRNLIIGILVLEFVLSFVSYFSNFKEVFLYIFMVYLTVNPNVKFKNILQISPLVAGLIFILVFWSTEKDGYRAFLNKGSRQQQVSVGKLEALDYISGRAQVYDVDSFAQGGEVLLNRIQYMRQYSLVYTRVPEIMPYANGENIMGTLKFLLIPRSLSDNKPILDPSTKASYYTGKSFANASQGTSISLGYFCDLYVDFGLWIMIIPLIIIAFFIGRGASYIINYGEYNIIFTYSLFIGVFLSLGTFESDIIFYLGSIRNYIVVIIVGNILVFPWIAKYTKK